MKGALVKSNCYDIWQGAWEQRKKKYCQLNENMLSDGRKNTETKQRARTGAVMVMGKLLWFLTGQQIKH